MIVNEMKTNIVIYGTDDRHFSFLFNNKQIDVVESYKYLGCIFNSCKTMHGNVFREMIKYTADKGLKACFAMVKKCNSVGYISPKVGFHLFDSCISPILNYSCDIWSSKKEIQCIEKVQLKFIKFLQGVKSSTCNMAIYGETGRFPLYLYHKCKVIDYWIRLELLPENKLVKQSFNMIKNLHQCGFKTWLEKVENILKEANMGPLQDQDYLENKAGNLKHIYNSVKQALYDDFTNSWPTEINEYPKMRTYVTFKQELRMETYLLEIKDFKLRRLLSRFRLSSHDLEIERGRYLKPPVPASERFCKTCQNNCIEDEKHILVECQTYSKLRSDFFEKLPRDITVLENPFAQIMSSKISTTIFLTCKFLEKALLKRSQILNMVC